MTAFDASPTDFGTDAALLNDLAPVWGLVSNDVNYAYSVGRHLSQREGSMDFYDPTYVCFDIRSYCSAKMNKALMSRLQGRIVRAVESDRDRTQRCTASIAFDNVLQGMTLTLQMQTNQGPFSLVFAASALTLSILTINGVAAAQLPPVAGAQPVTIVIQQGGNLPGPPGPAGSSNPSRSYGLQAVESSLGTEDPQLQSQLDEINWGALGSSLTLELGGMALDEGGTGGSPGTGVGVIKLRINGADGAADGTVEITLNATSASATNVHGTVTIANPGGLGRVILTVTSSAAGKTCIMRGITFTIQSN